MAAASLFDLVRRKEYRRSWLRPDVLAGVTVAAMLVPQAMAYAELGGLPPSAGFRAALVALPLYALIGTSRHLGVGHRASGLEEVGEAHFTVAKGGLGAPEHATGVGEIRLDSGDRRHQPAVADKGRLAPGFDFAAHRFLTCSGRRHAGVGGEPLGLVAPQQGQRPGEAENRAIDGLRSQLLLLPTQGQLGGTNVPAGGPARQNSRIEVRLRRPQRRVVGHQIWRRWQGRQDRCGIVPQVRRPGCCSPTCCRRGRRGESELGA